MFHIRQALLPYAVWFGIVQSLAPPASGIDTTARIVGLATLLGSLTVLVYRLGVWRQELENTKDKVVAEVKAHRDESAVNFDRIERRIERLEAALAINGSTGE